jgi:hypothetical protein
VFWGFSTSVVEVSILLGCDTASLGNWLLTVSQSVRNQLASDIVAHPLTKETSTFLLLIVLIRNKCFSFLYIYIYTHTCNMYVYICVCVYAHLSLIEITSVHFDFHCKFQYLICSLKSPWDESHTPLGCMKSGIFFYYLKNCLVWNAERKGSLWKYGYLLDVKWDIMLTN